MVCGYGLLSYTFICIQERRFLVINVTIYYIDLSVIKRKQGKMKKKAIFFCCWKEY